MKKTLMVLSFALCATIAFAQTRQVAPSNVEKKAAISAVNQEDFVRSGYNGSVFAKEDVLLFCNFSATSTNYTTGDIGANEQVNGTVVVAHDHSSYYSHWHRINDTTVETLIAERDQHYPAMISRFGGSIIYYMGEAQTQDGFLVASMIDSYTPWGGDGIDGHIDTYVKFDQFSTMGYNMVRCNFLQFYRKFNYDKCYIDYSTDNQTWYGIEFNVRGVDMTGNSNVSGYKNVSLPSSLGNQPSVWVRVRYVDESDDFNGGYFFCLDDFSVREVPQNSLYVRSNKYYEGFYHMIPQGLNLPVVWVNQLTNDGQAIQTQVEGTIYTYDQYATTPATPLISKNIGNITSEQQRDIVIDPLGWYDSAADSRTGNSWNTVHGMGYYEHNNPIGEIACLPTQNAGVRHFFADVKSTAFPNGHIVGDTATFDTMRYEITHSTYQDFGSARQYGLWARDLGALRNHSYYAAGLVGENTYTTDPDETMWNQAGYGLFVSYVTGATVPQGWKILGMEMVASTEVGMQAVGARLDPILLYDRRSSFGDTISFPYVNTGASTYVVKEEDVIDESELPTMEFNVNGNYPTVRILFPAQPDLEPNMSYRVGYELVEEADFAVATSSNFYYAGGNEDSNTVWYGNVPGMESYGHALLTSSSDYNSHTVLISDPYNGNVNFLPTSNYPMIRLLVGPGYYVPKATITFQCEEEFGSFKNGQMQPLCGTTDTTNAVGGSASYYVYPNLGYKIDKVYINDVEVNDFARYKDADSIEYGILTIEDLTNQTYNLRCTFKEAVGFDPVAPNVAMRLMPNPASSIVNIALKGVTGDVNMSLIDMSGRVVYTNKFNAENGTSVNLSTFAKGAYFVRVTNDKFSKIEKLIVR